MDQPRHCLLCFLVGAYLLLGRPISQRYGTRSRSVDLVLGSPGNTIGYRAGRTFAHRSRLMSVRIAGLGIQP